MIVTLFWWAYCLIAATAIILTLVEYLQSQRQKLKWAFVGMVSCLAWPVLVITAMIMSRRRQPPALGNS